MKYNKLTEYFESEEGLQKLLEDYQDRFELVDDIGNKILQGILSSSEDYRNTLNELTGVYVNLIPIFKFAEAHKKNEELKYYVNKKRELEEEGTKVVASHLDKEASLSVAELRKVRNILEGYVLAAEKGITTCQTQLKRIENDNKYKPE